jgi:predicted  nucleic acid-binding Zn-ribbon protein
MVKQKSRAKFEAEVRKIDDEIDKLKAESDKLNGDISVLKKLKKQWKSLIIRIKNDFQSSHNQGVSDILHQNVYFLEVKLPDLLKKLTAKDLRLMDEDLKAKTKQRDALTTELDALKQF